MRECAARALTVHADAVETLKDYTAQVFGPVDTFVSAMLEHLERRNSQVVDSTIARTLRNAVTELSIFIIVIYFIHRSQPRLGTSLEQDLMLPCLLWNVLMLGWCHN